MGGNYYNNSRQKKSSSNSVFSVFNLFKSKKISQVRADEYDAPSARRVWPSDDDRGLYWPVAEPGIDRKAEDFIAKIHRNIASDYECKTFTIPSTTASKA